MRGGNRDGGAGAAGGAVLSTFYILKTTASLNSMTFKTESQNTYILIYKSHRLETHIYVSIWAVILTVWGR